VDWGRDTHNNEDAPSVFFELNLPGSVNGGLEGGPKGGVGVMVDCTLSSNVLRNLTNHFYAKYCWGKRNVFGKPWAEAVCEGSPHFPGGKLEVKGTVRLAVTKGDAGW
jgi:hypothetical protein